MSNSTTRLWGGRIASNSSFDFPGLCSFSGRSVQFSSVAQSDSLQPHGLQHTSLPCPSPTPGAYSNSCPLSRWCHPAISSSVIPFSSHLQSFQASGSFQISQFFASSGQRIGVSVSASDQISHSVLSNSLRPHELQHTNIHSKNVQCSQQSRGGNNSNVHQ